MKTTLLTAMRVLLLFASANVHGQINQWQWIGGDSTISNTAVFGALGVPSVSVTPGTRSEAVTWTDSSGALWLFGGRGYVRGTVGYFNDLWKYNPSTAEWTWVKGDSTLNNWGRYGTL